MFLDLLMVKSFSSTVYFEKMHFKFNLYARLPKIVFLQYNIVLIV